MEIAEEVTEPRKKEEQTVSSGMNRVPLFFSVCLHVFVSVWQGQTFQTLERYQIDLVGYAAMYKFLTDDIITFFMD